MNDQFITRYLQKLKDALNLVDTEKMQILSVWLWDALQEKRQVFLCGNGGSAANALHIANDLFYGMRGQGGIRTNALTANQSIMTCLANDISYEEIFSNQVGRLGQKEDILIALSGSGNSMNIIKAIEAAKAIGMKTCAVLGYDGGRCLEIADVAIHIPVHDMQVAEDIQLVIGHMIMRWVEEKILSRQQG